MRTGRLDRRVFLLVALLLSFLLAFLFLRDQQDRRRVEDAPVVPAAARPFAQVTSPSTIPPPRRTAMKSRDGAAYILPNPGELPGDSSEPPAPAEAASKWRLTGVVHGPGGSAAAGVTLLLEPRGYLVHSDDKNRVVGRAAADGSVDIDVTRLMAEGGVTELEVRVDDPRFLPAMFRVLVPGIEGDGAEGDGVLSFPPVELIPAVGLKGRVVNAESSPVPGASVAIFAGRPDSFGPGAMDAATADAEGAWALRVRPGAEAVLVAAAEGFRPVFTPLAGGTSTVPDMVLTAGASITGMVRGPDGAPVEGVHVVAVPETDEDGFGAGHVWITRVQGRVERSYGDAVTDSSGRYRIQGLPEEWCKVAPSYASLSGGASVLSDFLDTLERRVRPPSAEVDFSLVGCWVDLEVVAEGRPASGAQVEFGGWWGPQMDKEGRGSVLGRPSATYEVRVSQSGFHPWKGNVTTGRPKERVAVAVQLRPLRPGGDIDIVLENPGGVVPDLIRVACPESGKEWDRFRDGAQVLDGDAGRFRLKGLEEGSHRLILQPGAHRDFGSGYFHEEIADVEVPEEGSREVLLRIRAAGRLRIAARDVDGNCLEAECRIQDSGGKDVDASFWYLFANGSGASPGWLVGRVPNDVEPTLAPGRYSVRITLKGYLDRVVEATVVAGRTTEVDAILERR